MGWYGVVRRVASDRPLKEYLRGESDPMRTLMVAANEAEKMLEDGEFTDEEERRVRRWLGA